MIIRRPMRPLTVQKDGPRSNRDIRVPEIQLIDAEGENKGVISTSQALEMAQDAGLDLVEISPNAQPPVCKILDLGKFKYQAQKKAAEARKKQKVIDVKEIKIRPGIDTHDYEIKMRNVVKFLEGGDKVKVTMRFRGREITHQELGVSLMQKIKQATTEIAKVEAEPKTEGRQMIMVLAPVASK